ncbi:MAG: hypothetical protein LKE28_06405 [Sphaerochaeta sp.]|nr:hypothetical protein [Sphaerochaeta sp.]
MPYWDGMTNLFPASSPQRRASIPLSSPSSALPVPMLVGTDYQGIAREIEAKTGIPSFGFDTTGLDFYDKGVVMATKELLKRFAPRTNHYQQIPHTINIVGATPLDWGKNGNDTACRSVL